MLRKYDNFSFRNNVPSKVTFYCPDLMGFAQTVQYDLSSAEAKTGFPDKVHELHDVFVVAGRQRRCLYDSGGRRIPESCITRDRDGSGIYWKADEAIALPTKYLTIDEPQLYQSELFDHWGHFLIESTSRLWARYAHPELQAVESVFLPHWNHDGYNANILQFLDSFHAPLKQRALPLAARIKTCFVPEASFSESVDGYSGHLACMHDVAATFLRKGRPERSRQPVYLSRSRLQPGGPTPRVIVNEAEFEGQLSSRGFKIVHAEALSLEQQVSLFNSHDVFVGCKGSALHNIVFCLRGSEITTYTICTTATPKSAILLDALVGNTANYLGVLSNVGGGPSPVKQLSIDIDAALSHFRDVGLI